jgi:hypothetical protein
LKALLSICKESYPIQKHVQDLGADAFYGQQVVAAGAHHTSYSPEFFQKPQRSRKSNLGNSFLGN